MNTSSVIKKMFLYMIMFIKQKVINNIKWKQQNKQILKIELNIFRMILLILKILNQTCYKLTKNHTKTLIFKYWIYYN